MEVKYIYFKEKLNELKTFFSSLQKNRSKLTIDKFDI